MCEKYKLYPGLAEEQSRYWSDRVATITEEGGQRRDINEAARRYLTQGAHPHSVAHMSSDTVKAIPGVMFSFYRVKTTDSEQPCCQS
jgi:hypothetical protein